MVELGIARKAAPCVCRVVRCFVSSQDWSWHSFPSRLFPVHVAARVRGGDPPFDTASVFDSFAKFPPSVLVASRSALSVMSPGVPALH
eukprot:6280541-Pyramimonas_sp.AAC.1